LYYSSLKTLLVMKNIDTLKTPEIIPNNQHTDIPGNPSTAKSSTVKLRQEATHETLRVMTLDQWNFWKEEGYVVLKNIVPREQVEQTAEFLWEFEDKNPNDRNTWYTAARAELQMKELAGTGQPTFME